MPHAIQVKSMLNKTRRRDPWFFDDYTINPYSGCSFNCLYCYIRGSKYGINMAEKVSMKENAIAVLEKQLSLRARKGQYGVVVLSSATDPYLQFENETRLTRSILELILEYRFPVHIITKSDLVIRDFDLLKAIGRVAVLPKDLQTKLKEKVFITFSFSTLDTAISKLFEPGATPPANRLEAHRAALDLGFLSGISLMPLLPYISDTGENLDFMFQTFKRVGSRYVFPATITLFGQGAADNKTLVFRAVEKNFPHLLEKYKRLFSDSSSLPAFYKAAFQRKTLELSAHYGLNTSIVCG